jgi:two-component system, cell cycle sensor histidine kinase PleC
MRTFGKSWFKNDSLIAGFGEGLGLGESKRQQALALDAARVDAELASKAKSDFIANMSHELRTPLNAIIGFSDLLINPKLNADQEKSKEYAGYISEAAHHLLALINSILDISKIQAGKLEVHPIETNIHSILDPCLLLTQAKAKEKNITIDINIGAAIPALKADPLRLKQILINLLSNAVKFTPERGKVQVEVSNRDEKFVSISISDTGPGMDPHEIVTALRPFGQMDNSLNRRTEGTGLGLPIAQSLARLHGGELQVTSRKGVGSKMTVLIPHIGTYN